MQLVNSDYTLLTSAGIVRRWNNSRDLYFEGNGLYFPAQASQLQINVCQNISIK